MLMAAAVYPLLAAGCSYGHLTATNESRASVVEFDKPPAYFDDGSLGQSVGRDRFLTLAHSDDDLLSLTMWSDTLGRLWTTEISIPDRTPLGTKMNVPRSPEGEKPAMIFRSGRQLVMLSTRYSEDDVDSLYAIARLIDPATGKITEMKTLTAAKVNPFLEQRDRRYRFAMSDDSTTILCTLGDVTDNEDDDSVMQHLATFNGDLTPARSRTVRLAKSMKRSTSSKYYTMRVDNLGDVILVAHHGNDEYNDQRTDTFEIRRIGMGGGKSDTAITFVVTHPTIPSAHVSNYIADFTGSNDLTLFTLYRNDNLFAGLGLLKVRTSTMERTLTTMLDVDQEDFERIVDQQFTRADFNKVYVSQRADARYLITANGSYGGFMSMVGNTYFMISTDNEGKENWRAIHRLAGLPPLSSYAGTDGNLHVVYREVEGLVYDEFDLTSGARVPDSRRLLVEADLQSITSPGSFVHWAANKTVILFMTTPAFGAMNWYLYRLEMKR